MSDFIWVEKYRPKTIDECILPEGIKKTFSDFLNKGEIPNMLLAGFLMVNCIINLTVFFRLQDKF